MDKRNFVKDITPRLVLIGKDAKAEHQILQGIKSALEDNYSYSTVSSVEPILEELLCNGSPNAAQECLLIMSEIADKLQNGFLQDDIDRRESIIKLILCDLLLGIQKRSPHPYFMKTIVVQFKKLIYLINKLETLNEISKLHSRIAEDTQELSNKPEQSKEIFEEIKTNLKYFQRKLTLDEAIGNPDYDKLS